MERFLQDSSAASSSQKRSKVTASSSFAALKDPCWKHFKDIEREASDTYWYRATCSFCSERLRLKTGRARAHLGCVSGQNIKTCSRVPPEIKIQFGKPTAVSPAPLEDRAQHTLRDAFSSRDSARVDGLVARFFYSNGLAFNIADSVAFREMLCAVAHFGAGYSIPSPYRLANPLLDAECKRIAASVSDVIKGCTETGMTIPPQTPLSNRPKTRLLWRGALAKSRSRLPSLRQKSRLFLGAFEPW